MRLHGILHPTLLVLAGVLLSQGLQAAGLDARLGWDDLHTLAWYGLLPLIVYEMAFRLDAEGMFRSLGLIVWLAVPLLLVQALLAASLLYLGLGDAVEFPFMAAFLTALMLAANSPAAVIRVLEPLRLPTRLLAILKGESLFGSLLVLILVSLLLQLEGETQPPGFLRGFIHFTQLFAGGVLAGLVLGLTGIAVMHFSRLPLLRGVLSLIGAYLTFVVAETLLAVSGISAVLVAGLILNAYRQRTDAPSQRWLDRQWQGTALVAAAFMFLLLGFSVYWPILLEQWHAVLLGMLAVLLARGVAVVTALWLDNGASTTAHDPATHQPLLLWLGGFKGMISILLVFALPAQVEYSYSVQAIVFGVVLGSLLVQAPLLQLFLWVRSQHLPLISKEKP